MRMRITLALTLASNLRLLASSLSLSKGVIFASFSSYSFFSFSRCSSSSFLSFSRRSTRSSYSFFSRSRRSSHCFLSSRLLESRPRSNEFCVPLFPWDCRQSCLPYLVPPPGCLFLGWVELSSSLKLGVPSLGGFSFFRNFFPSKVFLSV